VSTTTLSLQEQTLGIAKVSRVLDELEQRLAGLDVELHACSSERRKYKLLSTILDSLDALDALEAADLFWNRESTGYSPDTQLQKVREHVAAFDGKVADLEVRREQIESQIEVETDNLRSLNHGLAELEEEAEALRQEFRVFRDPSEIPYRPLVMPWSRNGEDDRRYRKIFLASLAISLSVGSVVFLFKPGHEKRQEEFIPEHVAELIVKKKEEPKKPEHRPQDNKSLERATTSAKDVEPPVRMVASLFGIIGSSRGLRGAPLAPRCNSAPPRRRRRRAADSASPPGCTSQTVPSRSDRLRPAPRRAF